MAVLFADGFTKAIEMPNWTGFEDGDEVVVAGDNVFVGADFSDSFPKPNQYLMYPSDFKPVEVSFTFTVTKEFLDKLKYPSVAPAPVLTPEEEEVERVERARRRMTTLAYVNRVRRDFDLPPLDALVPGKMGDKNGCVIARSIVAGSDGSIVATVGMSAARVEDRFGVRHYQHEMDVHGFVEDFDRGLHSDLTLPE